MRLTTTTMIVLQFLLRAPEHGIHGFALIQDSGLKAGTVYPILKRLLDEQWCESYWEDPDVATAASRARRRYFRLTELGRTRAAEPIRRGGREYQLMVTEPAPSPVHRGCVHDDTTNR